MAARLFHLPERDAARLLADAHRRRKPRLLIAGNLPGGPINMIGEDPVSPNVLYAANDFGVYGLAPEHDAPEPHHEIVKAVDLKVA